MVEIAIGVLTGVLVVSTTAAVMLLLKQKKQAQLARERATADALQDAKAAPANENRLVHTLAELGAKLNSGTGSRELREKLATAGFHAEAAASIYMGSKLLLLCVGALVAGALVLPLMLKAAVKLSLVAMVAGICFLVPNMVLGLRRRSRSQKIRRNLPDAIDLLEICVSAGMGLDMAWNAVAEEVRRVNPPLADEMELTNLEINLGSGRAVAMRHMAERTGAEEISSLVALLVQAERFGASIVDALTTFADTMREMRSSRAEEAAEKMTVKMLFPMVLFIFPPLLIVMVGPAVVELTRTISGR